MSEAAKMQNQGEQKQMKKISMLKRKILADIIEGAPKKKESKDG